MIAVALLAPATASAATIWATPDHNTAGGPDRNQADFWGDDCTKLPEGGLGSAVAAALVEAGVQQLRLAHLSVSELPVSGTPAELLAAAGIDGPHIASAAAALIGE